MERKITEAIEEGIKLKERLIVAIDGRCASGKTTLAKTIEEKTDYMVVHMDDFFQPREKRRDEIGGNIDFDRLINDVLEPFKKGEKVSYRPFLCKSQTFGDKIIIEGKNVILLEGTYSTHERLEGYYDYAFFTHITKEEQLERIKKRNPENFEDFINIWLLREEEYFKTKK